MTDQRVYSCRLIFRQSRSKNYSQAVKLASAFSNYQPGEENVVDISMKEIFEKWEYFNLLFWRTVDWKGTILEWEGMAFHSHCDKTRIFYALQHAHISYICFTEKKIRVLPKVYSGELKYDELDLHVYSEDDMNMLLDTFNINKDNKKVTDDESLSNIKIRNQPWFLGNKLKF